MKGKVSPTMSAANWSTMRKNGVCTCVEEGQVCVRECSLRSFRSVYAIAERLNANNIRG